MVADERRRRATRGRYVGLSNRPAPTMVSTPAGMPTGRALATAQAAMLANESAREAAEIERLLYAGVITALGRRRRR